MATDPTKAMEAAKKAGEKAAQASDTKKQLEGIKGKVEVFSDVGKKLKELARDFKNLDAKERVRRIGSILVMGVLGYAFGDLKKEEREWLPEGAEGIDEPEEVAEELVNEVYDENYEAEEEEFDKEEYFEEEAVIPRRQAYVNMYAMRYFNKDGSLYKRPSGIFRGKNPCKPSKFILRGSSALFEKGKAGLQSFDEFVERVTDKLVDKSVKDKQERIRQAALMLSHCAIGRYQILPIFHFKKMGWPTKGIEGLRAMYDFIRENDRQIDTHMQIIKPLWNRYHDPAHVGIAYYAGESKVTRFKKNPDAPEFTQQQFGGFGSIQGYANRTRSLFARAKQRVKAATGREATDLEALEIALERIESGGSTAFARITQREKRERIAVKPPKGTRRLADSEVTDAIETEAKKAYAELKEKPYGSSKKVAIGDREYVFQVTEHYNRDPNGTPGIDTFEVV